MPDNGDKPDQPEPEAAPPEDDDSVAPSTVIPGGREYLKGPPYPPYSFAVERVMLTEEHQYARDAVEMCNEALLEKSLERIRGKWPDLAPLDLPEQGPYFSGAQGHEAVVARQEELDSRLDDWFEAAEQRAAELHWEELGRLYPGVPEENREHYNGCERWKRLVVDCGWLASATPANILTERRYLQDGGFAPGGPGRLDLRGILGDRDWDRLQAAERKLFNVTAADHVHAVETLIELIEKVQDALRNPEPGPAEDAGQPAVELEEKVERLETRVKDLELRDYSRHDLETFGTITLREAALVVGWDYETSRRKLDRLLKECLAPDPDGVVRTRRGYYPTVRVRPGAAGSKGDVMRHVGKRTCLGLAASVGVAIVVAIVVAAGSGVDASAGPAARSEAGSGAGSLRRTRHTPATTTKIASAPSTTFT